VLPRAEERQLHSQPVERAHRGDGEKAAQRRVTVGRVDERAEAEVGDLVDVGRQRQRLLHARKDEPVRRIRGDVEQRQVEPNAFGRRRRRIGARRRG
jgi:hypothetical protein